ncbi:MAG: hypothetical protein AAF799_22090 [Myxococcota bacterium]
MASPGSKHARWPDGLLFAKRHERWREQTSEDPRLAALRARDGSDDDIVSTVAAARSAGFEQIVLQHDDPSDEAPRDWAALRDAGLTAVSVRVEGGTADLHDFIAAQTPDRPAPDLVTLEATCRQIRQHGLAIHFRTRVARSNFRSLEGVLRRAMAWDAKTWTLEYLPLRSTELPPEGVGHAHPRLALSLPWVLRSGARAAARRVVFALRGAPLCLLGPLAPHAVLEQPAGFGPTCESCPARNGCVGADPTYLERFGLDELRPRATPTTPSVGWWSVAPILY